MQNKAAIAANATQHEIIHEAAEQQRQEEKAGKQLERVQQQMAEFVQPVQTLCGIHTQAYHRAVFECGCETYMATYAIEYVSPPMQPYGNLFSAGKPEMFKRVAANPFTLMLPPEDLARLAGDPARRTRWEELMVHTVLPPMREILPVIQTKVCTTRCCPSAKERLRHVS